MVLRRINYVGPADNRVVYQDQIIALGLPDPGQDLIWGPINGYERDVEETTAAYLLANSPEEFLDDAGLNFGAILNGTFAALAGQRVWLGPSAFSLQGGAATLVGGAGDGAMQAWLLDAASTEFVSTTFTVPGGWSSVALDLWWLNQGAGAGDAVWWLVLREWVDGGAAAGTAVADQTRTETALGQGVMNRREDYLSAIAVDPERLYRLQVGRVGDSVSDTLANDVGMLGCVLRRTG